MIRHYFDPAFANIVRAPFTTAVSIFTLALGLCCFFVVWGVVSYWRLSDQHFASADRTVAIAQQVSGRAEGGMTVEQVSSGAPVAPHFREDFPQLESVTRLQPRPNASIQAGDRKQTLQGASVDPEFLNIFDLPFGAGSPASALQTPSREVRLA